MRASASDVNRSYLPRVREEKHDGESVVALPARVIDVHGRYPLYPKMRMIDAFRRSHYRKMCSVLDQPLFTDILMLLAKEGGMNEAQL